MFTVILQPTYQATSPSITMRFALIVLAFAVVFVAASPSMDKKKKKTAPPVEAPVEETPAEVHRHRGRFYIHSVGMDGYPSGLGVRFMRSVPQEPKQYAQWVAERRKFLDDMRAGAHPDYEITLTPMVDVFAYEIDLDHHIFHYQGFPMFRLDNLPPESFLDDWEDIQDRDVFGNPMPSPALPEEHACRWRAILPPNPYDVEVYQAYKATGKSELLQEILDGYNTLSKTQDCRVRLYEVITNAFVYTKELYSALCSSELQCDDAIDAAPIPQFALDKGIDIDAQYEKRRAEYLWIYYNLCAKAARSLDQEPVLQGAVGDLVRHIREMGKQGIVYGVLCSLFHVVIVRVDMANDGTLQHTPALAFLPPRRAANHRSQETTPYPQGIDALMKLSFRLQDGIFHPVDTPRAAETTHPPTYFDKLPFEIIQHIFAEIEDAGYTIAADALTALASLNENVAIVVAPRVFLPSVNGCTLSAVLATKDLRCWQLSVMFEWHARCCAFHPEERCGLRMWYQSWVHRVIPIFTVGGVGVLAVLTEHETLATFSGRKDY
ncbi:hypothetical protein PC9H_009227 [Pleurotus ostreatus]|uniref:Uncharacterized protein n=1 Tax=Pleurotus ostreatus TaxID=5322 RepID=A0A8H6ZP07_PLEOS|nr:uncharacterized protein PC9H_009227 [Pleurotus ostreatus]KAF7423929.1 hypothetical protein PC9H_009227 [Pleurotus ostreatus]